MLHLKLANVKDVDTVTDMLSDLFDTSVYSTVSTFNYEEVQEKVLAVVKTNQEDGCIILLKDGSENVGVLICSSTNHFFNSKEKTAIELAFYLEPEYRTISNAKKLLGAYKFWAKKIGCTSIMVGKINNINKPEEYRIRKL